MYLILLVCCLGALAKAAVENGDFRLQQAEFRRRITALRESIVMDARKMEPMMDYGDVADELVEELDQLDEAAIEVEQPECTADLDKDKAELRRLVDRGVRRCFDASMGELGLIERQVLTARCPAAYVMWRQELERYAKGELDAFGDCLEKALDELEDWLRDKQIDYNMCLGI